MSNRENLNKLLDLRDRAESRFVRASEAALAISPMPVSEEKVGRAAALAMICGRLDMMVRRETQSNRKRRNG